MPNDKLLKLQEMMKLINEGVSRSELETFMKEIVKFMKSRESTNSSEWKLIHQAMQKIPDKMMSEMMSSMSTTEKKMVSDCMDKCEKMCSEMEKKHKAEMGKMDLEVRMIKADREAIIEDALAKIPAQIIETPEMIRDKLELLEGNERLDVKAIKNLKEELEKLKRELTERITSIPRGMAARSSNAMKPYPLTPDGSTKIFGVPKSVAGFIVLSDFPHVLMENAGYTINASRTQVTLTVDNAPALNSQLLYVYASMFNT